MNRFALLVSLLALGCSRALPEARTQGPSDHSGARASVVVNAFVEADGGGGEWRPLCGGTAIRPRLVLTSLDCLSPRGTEVLELAVSDANDWITTASRQRPSKVWATDPERRLALLLIGASDPLDMTIGDVLAVPHEGDPLFVERDPERTLGAVAMAVRDDGGFISAPMSACKDIAAGAAVYDVRGLLVGIVTKGGLAATEYAVPRFIVSSR